MVCKNKIFCYVNKKEFLLIIVFIQNERHKVFVFEKYIIRCKNTSSLVFESIYPVGVLSYYDCICQNSEYSL